ncbi:hypothetical protein QAD02_003936 [Eretmocerus hayati]|uniref:Uncharacterized protein n=1 Tax=Eretmocerus hayati TaxID=131215 RepID=A0ACC2NP36_9HYME|nr:hypothetical protein QAD02_003936 [Eretmocerus hayati]
MSSLQNSNLIAAAVGATIGVISVATVFIYHKIMERQQHTTMNKNIDRVSNKVVELQAQLEELRTQQANLQKSRRKRLMKRQIHENNSVRSEDIDTDTFSTAGTDFGDDEFYDCSDDEESAPVESELGNSGETMNEDSVLMELDKEAEDASLRSIHYQKLKNLLLQNANDAEIIWRFARACYHCSLPVKGTEKEKEFIFEGLDVCEKVLESEHGNLYKWYAILIGIKSRFLPTKGKIENGYRFKEYVQKALDVMPDDPYLHHLLGRFEYEVSELSWIEKKVASTLFAEVPKGTYEGAIPYFETAEKLGKKPHAENKLFLAKSYIAVGKYREGVTWLNRLNEIAASDEEDKQVQEDAKKLLDKYSKYCT